MPLGAWASPVPSQGLEEHENFRTEIFTAQLDCFYF